MIYRDLYRHRIYVPDFIDPDDAVVPLTQVLRSDDELTRTNAAAVLGTLGDVRAAAALAWVSRTDDSDVVRQSAANALDKLAPGLQQMNADMEPNPAPVSLPIPMPWVVRTGVRYINRDAQERERFDVELDFIWESTSDVEVFDVTTDAIIRIGIGGRRAAEHVAVADHLVLDLDDDGHAAGFWLTNVPPFPKDGTGG